MMFTGFPEATIQFFLDIRFHNSIDYFEENRARYERDVKAPFEAFIQELAPAMLSIDPQMELRPYRCMARLRRDGSFHEGQKPLPRPFVGTVPPCGRTARGQRDVLV